MEHKKNLFNHPIYLHLLFFSPRAPAQFFFIYFPSSPRLSLQGPTTSPLSPPSSLRPDNSACQSCADTAQLTRKVGEERKRERSKGGRGRGRQSAKRPSGCVSSLQSRQCIILHSLSIVCVSTLYTLGRASRCNTTAKLQSTF